MAVCWILSKFELWKRKVNILVLGAGNSGKTTLCYLLQEDLFSPQYQQQREGHQCEISLKKIILNLDDMSGNNGVRTIYPQGYLAKNIEGFILMVDASDPNSFESAKSELNIVTQIPEWRTKPILILGNKIDLIATAVTEIQLQEALCLSGITSNTLNIKLQMCSIVRRVGYSSGFKWLSEQICSHHTAVNKYHSLDLNFLLFSLLIGTLLIYFTILS